MYTSTQQLQQKELPWRDTNHSPLTGNDLRNLVIEASIREETEDDDDSFLNVPGIAWLEHVNLIVGGTDRQMATTFYIDIMGMTADKSKSFHVNLGRQQFHLAIPKKDDDDEEEEIPHRISGSIGLAVPDIYALKERLIQAKKEEENNNNSNNSFHDTDTTILIVRCPWGNIFRCYSANDRGRTTTASSPSEQKMTNLHSLQIGQHGPDKMGVLSVGQPGIRYIEFLCPYRSSNQIYNFYRTILRCSCYCTNVNSTTSRTGTSDIDTYKTVSCCVVSVGPGVHLVFVEESESKSYSNNHSELSSSSDDTMTTMNKKMMKGVHICIYVHDFYGLYNRLTDNSLIWTNPRFVRLDTCTTWEEAKKSRTLRFRYIIDINNQKHDESNNKDNQLVGSTSVGSNILMELEHETRPIRHGQFMKVPYYVPK
ncbi:hypothetical protein FRACYDRAFT_179213 [Fragilariopsis cylindrus CCMP1102]|uniref:VOC domain-containing protein n=1 Tax=Fragilariopsis cylindrus CCMP1102 TaxID=635003 RepID=A0A1E7FYA9_9STRA|nr:hypothetical protein FRACYDRAFT_179213 [Fragilariopsis cylindrus CCMP1102]|eukprot:OEU23130.1 hypothetical protein FRACYDRAFT_179213 [Fragilariopsis cylindrus CCMP1102]